MLKPALTASLLIAATTSAFAETETTTTTTADTLVVITPNAPVVVTQGGPPVVAQPITAPGAAEMPPPPVAPQAANGAPQNEHWANVSHINGVPVKVGERQDYLYKPKKYNLSANPFGFFFGYYDLAGSIALGSNLGATVAVTGWDFGEWDQGYQISATLPLYFRKTFSGPFLEGGLLIRSTDESDYYAYDCIDCSSSMSDSWVGPQLLFGWHWTFDSGLNTSFAFGVAKRMDSGSDEPDANGYFRVGYAF
jgi:hypothetical protein